MPHAEDFTPDAEGLQEALRLLVQARNRPGSPYVNPAVAIDVPELDAPEAHTGVAAREVAVAPLR